MLSSFRIIKSNSVVSQGSKSIVTDYSLDQQIVAREIEGGSEEAKVENTEEKAKEFIQEYENLAKIMIENARKQSEAIIAKAMEDANKIKEETYKDSYRKGYEEGTRKGYSETIDRAGPEAERILENASNVLKAAKLEYEEYLKQKEKEILELSINIASHILRHEVENADGIDMMLLEALEASKNADTIIIRINSVYVDNVKAKLSYWKESLALKSETFIISDDNMDKGNAVVEKNNGKVIVGIDMAMENIKKALL